MFVKFCLILKKIAFFIFTSLEFSSQLDVAAFVSRLAEMVYFSFRKNSLFSSELFI